MQLRSYFLEQSEIEKIHQAALRILEHTGIKIGSDLVLEKMAKAGCPAEGSHLRLPRELVLEALAQTQRNVLLGAQRPEAALCVPEAGRCFQCTSGFAASTMDRYTRRLRKATVQDLEEMALVADQLSPVDMFWPLIMPTDCHPRMEEVLSLAVSLRCTGKHVQCSCSSGAVAPWMLRLGALFAGGEEKMRAQPIFSGSFSPISPLYFDKYGVEGMALLAEAGIPVAPMTMASMGTKAPVTIAGTLALVHAEELAALVIVKLFNPSAPFIYAADVPPADLRSGVVDYASPEYILLCVALGQLAQHVGMPSMVSHASSEAVPLDYSSLERNILYAAWGMMAGSDISSWIGTFDNVLGGSVLHLIKDAEISLQARAYCRRFVVDEASLALEAIDRVGPGGHFLADTHTLQHLHDDLWSRKWAEGFLLPWHEGEDYYVQLNETAEAMLILARERPRDEALEKEMDKLLQEAQRALV